MTSTDMNGSYTPPKLRGHRHHFTEVDVHGYPTGLYVCTDWRCKFGYGPGKRVAEWWEARQGEGQLSIDLAKAEPQ